MMRIFSLKSINEHHNKENVLIISCSIFLQQWISLLWQFQHRMGLVILITFTKNYAFWYTCLFLSRSCQLHEHRDFVSLIIVFFCPMTGTEEMLTVRRSKENGKDETNGEREINNPTCSKSRDESKQGRRHTGSR